MTKDLFSTSLKHSYWQRFGYIFILLLVHYDWVAAKFGCIPFFRILKAWAVGWAIKTFFWISNLHIGQMMYFCVKLRTFQGFFISVWFGVGQDQKTEFSLIWKHWSSLWVEVQCSIIPGILSDVSTQTKPIFSFVFGFYGGYFKKNVFLNIFWKIKKCFISRHSI